jgi:hypothetical protein
MVITLIITFILILAFVAFLLGLSRQDKEMMLNATSILLVGYIFLLTWVFT